MGLQSQNRSCYDEGSFEKCTKDDTERYCPCDIECPSTNKEGNIVPFHYEL